MFKRLVSNSGIEYYINREEVSAIIEQGKSSYNKSTDFIIAGNLIKIDISFEKAMTWFTTAD